MKSILYFCSIFVLAAIAGFSYAATVDVPLIRTLEGEHSGWVEFVSFAPNSRYLASESWDKVIVWDTDTWSVVATLDRDSSDMMFPVSFSPDSNYLALRESETIEVWDTNTWDLATTLTDKEATCVSFSLNGNYLAASEVDASWNSLVTVWDTATWEPVTTLSILDLVGSVLFSPDSSYLVARTYSEARVFDTATWNKEPIAILPTEEVCPMSFSPDSNYLALGTYDTVTVWDTATWSQVAVLEDQAATLGNIDEQFEMLSECAWDMPAVLFSPDGNYLAFKLWDTVKVWDTAMWNQEPIVILPTEEVSSISFSPNSNYLVAGVGNMVTVWDTTAWELAATLEGHKDWVIAVSFSPNGKYLASGARDTSVKVWDMGPYSLLEPFDLLSPQDNAWINTTPAFDWGDSASENGLSHYELWIDGALFVDGIAESHYTLTDAQKLSDGSHTWTVIAVDNNGNKRQANQMWAFNVDTTPPTALSGTVTDGVNPIPATVQAWRDGTMAKEVETPDGSYVLSDLSSGTYAIRAYSAGYYAAVVDGITPPATGVNFSLQRAPNITNTSKVCDFWCQDNTKMEWQTQHIPVLVQIGDVVTAKDPDDIICGTTTVGDTGTNEGDYFIHVYGDDPTTPGVDEGAGEGDTITFFINGYLASVDISDTPQWQSGDSFTVCLKATLLGGFFVSAGEYKNICHPNNGGETQIGGNPTAAGGTPDYTYSWSPTSGLDDPTSPNPKATPTETTTYTVTVTDSSEPTQEVSDSVTVTVHPELLADAKEGDTEQYIHLTSLGAEGDYTKNNTSITVDGKTEPDCVVVSATFLQCDVPIVIKDVTSDITIDAEGNISGTFTVGDLSGIEAVKLQLCVRDCAGNEGCGESNCLTVDNELPFVQITTPADCAYFYRAPITIAGRASDNISGVAKVEVNTEEGWIEANGTTLWDYDFYPPNENLPYTISARVRDKAGNQWKLPDTDAIQVNYFLAWPTANIRTPTDSSEVSCIVRITGSVDAIDYTNFEWLISFVPGVEEPCSEEPCSADNVIATGNTPVHEGLLALWDTKKLGAQGDYTLCLTVSNNQGAVYVRRNITVVNCTVQYGDVSGDGIVTAYDASLVMQAVVGSYSLSEIQRKAAEVTGDGKVTAYDAARILQYAAGLIDRFSTGMTFQRTEVVFQQK